MEILHVQVTRTNIRLHQICSDPILGLTSKTVLLFCMKPVCILFGVRLYRVLFDSILFPYTLQNEYKSLLRSHFNSIRMPGL